MIAAVEALVKAIGEQDHYHYWTGNKSDIMVTDTRTTKEDMRVIYTGRFSIHLNNLNCTNRLSPNVH